MGPGKPGPDCKVNWDYWTPRAIKMLGTGRYLVRDVARIIGVSTNSLITHLSEYRRAHPEQKFWWPRIRALKDVAEG